MPWWGSVIVGIAVIFISTYLFRHKNSPDVHFEGGSPGCVTTISVIFGIVLIVVGILGSSNPKVTESAQAVAERYSEVDETLSQIVGTLLFILLEVGLAFSLVIAIIMSVVERQRSEALIPLLIFTGLSIVYWVWISATNKFDEGFIEPFRHLYKLISR